VQILKNERFADLAEKWIPGVIREGLSNAKSGLASEDREERISQNRKMPRILPQLLFVIFPMCFQDKELRQYRQVQPRAWLQNDIGYENTSDTVFFSMKRLFFRAIEPSHPQKTAKIPLCTGNTNAKRIINIVKHWWNFMIAVKPTPCIPFGNLIQCPSLLSKTFL